ncbi:MAG: redox-sensing transcriptional repressor Rex [Rikenellaceae bacterium]
MDKFQEIPEKTIERLSEYRRTLLNKQERGITHVYSHTLARVHGITPVQVRRDFMLIGFSTKEKKGYDVSELIQFISTILDSNESTNVAILGMGHLAKAVTNYFKNKRAKLKIAVSLDNNPEKVGATIAGIPCKDIKEIDSVIKEYDISMLLLTLPSTALEGISEIVKNNNIKGVVNFTGKHISDLENLDVWVEDFDIITTLEKVAYYTKKSI